jgi:hypothetical protein
MNLTLNKHFKCDLNAIPIRLMLQFHLYDFNSFLPLRVKSRF